MVKPNLQKFNGAFLMKSQNTILSAAFVLGMASGINAFLGFLKGRLLAGRFGVSDDLAIFYTADRIPNLIYSVLVLGALSTIFIPVFTHIRKHDKEASWRTSSNMINISMLFFLLAGGVVFLFSKQTISILSVGHFTPEQITLGSKLMRIMLASQFILIISSFITCILQSFKYFLIPALSPIFYNLGMVLGIIFLTDKYDIYGAAYGVLIGAILHLLIQIPLLKKVDFKFHLSMNLTDKGLREIFALMPPRLVSVFIANAIATINNSLAILISSPSVVYLKFANQLQFFPVNLFGVSIASAVLPTLSNVSDEESLEKFKKTLITSLHQMLYLVLPSSVLLLILRIPVVRIVYGASNFPWEATVKTSYALAFFSISIFAQSSIYIFTRAFYALKDTKTPVIISSITIVINILLSLLFVKVFNWGVWALAFSFSITSYMDMLAMLYTLNKKVSGFPLEELLIPFTKMSYAAVVMGIALYIPLKFLDNFVFDTTRTLGLLLLTAITSLLGLTAYLTLTKLFNVEEVKLFYKILGKLKLTKTKPQQSILETTPNS